MFKSWSYLGLNQEISFPPTLFPAESSQWKKLVMSRNDHLTLTVQPRGTSRKCAIAALLLNAILQRHRIIFLRTSWTSCIIALGKHGLCSFQPTTAVALCMTLPRLDAAPGSERPPAAGRERLGAAGEPGTERRGTERNTIRFGWKGLSQYREHRAVRAVLSAKLAPPMRAAAEKLLWKEWETWTSVLSFTFTVALRNSGSYSNFAFLHDEKIPSWNQYSTGVCMSTPEQVMFLLVLLMARKHYFQPSPFGSLLHEEWLLSILSSLSWIQTDWTKPKDKWLLQLSIEPVATVGVVKWH